MNDTTNTDRLTAAYFAASVQFPERFFNATERAGAFLNCSLQSKTDPCVDAMMANDWDAYEILYAEAG